MKRFDAEDFEGVSLNRFEKISLGRGRGFPLERYSVRSCVREGVALVRRGSVRIPYSVLGTSREGAAAFAGCFRGLDHEELWVLGMSLDLRPGVLVRVGEGSSGNVGVDESRILRAVLCAGFPLFLLAHNHPGGDPTPSPDDWMATDHVCRAAMVVGLECVDHLVIGGGRYASLRLINPGLFERYGTLEEERS